MGSVGSAKWQMAVQAAGSGETADAGQEAGQLQVGCQCCGRRESMHASCMSSCVTYGHRIQGGCGGGGAGGGVGASQTSAYCCGRFCLADASPVDGRGG